VDLLIRLIVLLCISENSLDVGLELFRLAEVVEVETEQRVGRVRLRLFKQFDFLDNVFEADRLFDD
jgi:hypothetical protein